MYEVIAWKDLHYTVNTLQPETSTLPAGTSIHSVFVLATMAAEQNWKLLHVCLPQMFSFGLK